MTEKKRQTLNGEATCSKELDSRPRHTGSKGVTAEAVRKGNSTQRGRGGGGGRDQRGV